VKESAYQLITGRIIMMLQQGVVPWRKPWKAKSQWPQNLVSKHRYQGINVFLLHMMGYESPYWLTFHQARQLGGSVRKHEKATPIVLWKKIQREDETTEEKRTVLLLRYWSVFNVAQCDGLGNHIPAPELTVASEEPIAAATKIVEQMPHRPPIKHGFRKAFYSPVEDVVGMPMAENFGNKEEYFAVLFHELGHATGHATRLNRESLITARGDDPSNYPKEELCAEMTSAFLSGEAGIGDRTLENSAAYLQSWLKHLKDDPTLVIHAAAQAQKAADYILNRKIEDECAETPEPQKEAA
jgi:antirestriction protein ArdC